MKFLLLILSLFFSTYSADECAICFEQVKNPEKALRSCMKHPFAFCGNCLNESLRTRRTCPLCRCECTKVVYSDDTSADACIYCVTATLLYLFTCAAGPSDNYSEVEFCTLCGSALCTLKSCCACKKWCQEKGRLCYYFCIKPTLHNLVTQQPHR